MALSNNFCLHTGGFVASEADVFNAPVPSPTATYCPVSHESLMSRVGKLLIMEGIEVTEKAYAIAKGGNRMFSLMNVSLPSLAGQGDYQRILAVRNSYDGSMTAGFVLGSRVFVCDNLAFSGEIVVTRKHTKGIYEALPGMLLGAIAKLPLVFKAQDQKVIAYKSADLTTAQADHLILNLFREKVLSVTDIRRVLGEWEGEEKEGGRVFRHEEFAPRNAWSLFNGVTEVLKNIDSKGNPNPNLWDLPRQTRDMHRVFDTYLGVTIDVPSEVLN